MVRRRGLLALAAAAALGVAACGDDEPNAPSTSAGAASTSTATTTSTTTTTVTETAEREPAERRVLDLPARGHPVVWLRPNVRVALRDRPGGKVIAKLREETEWGSPTVLAVFERRGRWAGVPTPHRRNGELAWVRLDPRRLVAGSVPWEL